MMWQLLWDKIQIPRIFQRLRFSQLFIFCNLSQFCILIPICRTFFSSWCTPLVISSFGFYSNIWGRNYYYSSLTGEETSTQRLNDFLTKVTQIARGRSGIGVQLAWCQNWWLFLKFLSSQVSAFCLLICLRNHSGESAMHGKVFLLSLSVGLEDRDQFSLLSTSAEPMKGLAAEHPSIRTALTEQMSSLFILYSLYSLSLFGGELGNRNGEP